MRKDRNGKGRRKNKKMMEGRRKREEGEMGDCRGNEEEESEGKKVVGNRELWVEGIR